MARVFFRAMLVDADRSPTVGAERNMLGIRPKIDVMGGGAGPGCGGMSVTADNPKRMTPGVLPRAFGGLNAETVIFETVETTFGGESGLRLGPVDPKKFHAVVEAATRCAISEFQALLARTRSLWRRTAAPPEEGA